MFKKIMLFFVGCTFANYVSAAETQTLIIPDSVKTPGGSNLGYVLVGENTKLFKLSAAPVTKTIFDDKVNLIENDVPKGARYTGPTLPQPVKKQIINGLGYNGSIPGPTIIVNEGDIIRVVFTNHLDQPTTVHWHGIILPNDMDGAGGTDVPVVMPGESTVYEFPIVNKPGTYAYHSGFNDTKQVISGLRGIFIVLPKEGNDVKNDFAIMLQGWPVLGNGGETINTMSMANKFFTYNSLAAPNFPTLHAPYGEKVRIRFANMSADVAHPIHLHGYSFNITGTEGGPIQSSAQWPAATVATAPGQTRNIEFVANNPGIWRLHCHILHHIVNNPSYYADKKGVVPIGGMYTYLIVDSPKKKADLTNALPWVKNDDWSNYKIYKP
ncbi:multicopper oxidase domain-containing protein [Francisellaceae bacterium]|nr:multicopper oxidase domain-containing protein [Francisellaceae bacterium]